MVTPIGDAFNQPETGDRGALPYRNASTIRKRGKFATAGATCKNSCGAAGVIFVYIAGTFIGRVSNIFNIATPYGNVSTIRNFVIINFAIGNFALLGAIFKS
jgi:hypothetical protein